MSQQQWQPPAPSRPLRDGGGGGSVRRARERLDAGLPPEVPQGGRLYEQPRIVDQYVEPARTRQRPQMPPGLVETRNGGGPIGVAISKPRQVPQWPLAGTIESAQEKRNNYQPPAGRGVAPQRPPRPIHVPSMLDASRLQGPMPIQYQPSIIQEEDDALSPVLPSPNTKSQSSRPSTSSSIGTIPDFPTPQNEAPSRRNANLGPPPTSRRGNSTYYPQAGYVSPIPEESTPRTIQSYNSYASSTAIPTSWRSQNSPGYDFDDEVDSIETFQPTRQFVNTRLPSRMSERPMENESLLLDEDSDGRDLLRTASQGKRAKPSVVITKSMEKLDSSLEPKTHQSLTQKEKVARMQNAGVIGAAVAPLNITKTTQRDSRPIIGDTDSALATGTGLMENSSGSDETVPQISRAITTDEPTKHSPQPLNLKQSNMQNAYQQASTLGTPSPGFSRLSAIRRPPKLDMDAVRDAEKRGSLTSLPDLILRATRLAAMMDRGKRPASRLALDDFPSGDWGTDHKKNGQHHSSQNLSGMLGAFPAPGIVTPDRLNSPDRPISAWPGGGMNSYDPFQSLSSTSKRTRGRKCCGLPVWGFMLVLLILGIVIAAAVVVPLELLVIHKPSSSASSAKVLAACSSNMSTTCQNGGTSVLDGTSCACICTDGFTSSTCTNLNSTGCTTTTLSGLASKTDVSASLGSALPRLVSGAQSNFSIPLDMSTILARFSAANASCGAENALVTFDGRSGREGGAQDVVSSVSASSTSLPSPAPTAGTRRKIKKAAGIRDKAPAATTLSFDISSSSSSTPDPTSSSTTTTTTTPTSSPTPDSTPSPPAFSGTTTIPPYTSLSSSLLSAPSQTPSPSISSTFTPTETTLDFARTVVLYVLQQSTFNDAISSQLVMQHYFSLPDEKLTQNVAGNITLGTFGSVDLVNLIVEFGGNVVGGNETASVE